MPDDTGSGSIHSPVLVEEVLRLLAPASGQVILDGTVGFAGHARALLEASGPDVARITARYKQADGIIAATQVGLVLRVIVHQGVTDPERRVQTIAGDGYTAALARASIEDVLAGKVWAYSDEDRRGSKRQKDLADIMRLVETHPELRASLPDGLQSLLD